MYSESTNEANVTAYIQEWSEGKNEALLKLFPLIFQDLRNLASNQFRRERKNHTLQPTALVNECFMNMQKAGPVSCSDREHFFALATRVMRRILVDHARHRNRCKGPGSAELAEMEVDDISIASDAGPINLIALDSALNKLARVNKEQAAIAELRFFAGLTLEEVGNIMKITDRTVKRKWAVAKIWLHKELSA